MSDTKFTLDEVDLGAIRDVARLPDRFPPGVSADSALDIFKQSLMKGVGMSMLAFGLHYANSRSDDIRARKWMKRAAETGMVVAMMWMAELYEKKGNAEQRLVWLRHAAGSGDTDAKRLLGDAYLASSNPEDVERGIKLLHEAIECGDSEAHAVLAEFYLQKNDEEKCFVHIKGAAEAGSIVCMHNLADCYIRPRGTKRNVALAIHWLTKAADGGYEHAAARLRHLLPVEPDKDICGACCQPATNRCGGCLWQRYCSPACQAKHWRAHKPHCTLSL